MDAHAMGRLLWSRAALALLFLHAAAAGRLLLQEDPTVIDPTVAFGGRVPVAELGLMDSVALDEARAAATIPCTRAAVCDPAWAPAAAATVAIRAIRATTLDGEAATSEGACTGTLVGGPDTSKVYVISAAHCFANRTDVDQFRQWGLIFNWDAAKCSQPPTVPKLVEEVDVLFQALQPVFIDEASDILLMELAVPIPESFGAQVLSVQPSSVPPADAVVLHHPIGSYKHISYANSSQAPNGAAVAGIPQSTFLEEQLVKIAPQDHWQVKWTEGVTQGGSSGSALIDAATGGVVGVLSGGSSTCGGAAEDNADFYGRVDAAWAAGLWRFFSDSPPNATAADVLEQATQVAAGSGVNAQPPAFVLEPSAPSQAVQVYWGDPIPQGTSVTVNVSYEVVPGNSPGARGAAAATAADFEVAPAALTFTKQGGRDVTEGELQFVNAQTLTVSLAAGATVPDGTLVAVTLTPVDASGAPLPIESLNIKVLVADWTLEDAEINDEPTITALPYSAEAPLSAPEGRALWTYTAPEDQAVDVGVCKAAALNETGTALTVYDLSSVGPVTAVGDPQDVEGDGCVGIQSLQLTGGHQYSFILSDNDILLYALPISNVESFSLALSAPAAEDGASTDGGAAGTAAAPARR